jgi:predicted RNA-binding protein associated with RNAse of E/G family
LRLSIPGAPYSVLIFWSTEDNSLTRWYINLEEPMVRTKQGFIYTDLILDIVAVPDLSKWYWKDEGECKEAVNLGLLSQEKVNELRSEGEKAVKWLQSGKSPFSGWEKWKPDPSWQMPVLPDGWDAVE